MKRIIAALAICALSAVSALSAGTEQEPVRINYPRIFGVRPGAPLLFRVPVSGSRPFTVTAEGWPGGLSIDPSSGIVRGTIEEREKKTHTVNFAAKNATGSATPAIRFVVGDRICLTPPMGWNSWYVWYHTLTEKHFRDAATSFERNGLAGAPANIFCVDGNSAGTAGIAEMLLQSHGDVIELLPALPKAWPNGSVQGLKARGDLTVDLEWTEWRVRACKLSSPHPQPAKVLVNDEIRFIMPDRI